MIRKDFFRAAFWRMGYDASGSSELVDPSRARNRSRHYRSGRRRTRSFPVKWRGFNDEEVDGARSLIQVARP